MQKLSKVKALRIAKGISQSELAKASGVSKRSIENYEISRYNFDITKIETITNLAEALDVPFYDLLSDDIKSKVITNINKYHKPEH